MVGFWAANLAAHRLNRDRDEECPVKQPSRRWTAVGPLRRLGSGALALVLCAVGAGQSSSAEQLTPESPRVKQAVAKAVKYLGSAPSEKRIGGECLVGLALLKTGAEATHPKVESTARLVLEGLANQDAGLVKDNYDNALSIIFLTNLDAEKYKPQIQQLIDWLIEQQKPHGGWGYSYEATGDIPRLQYAVLALWEAYHAGFTVPVDRWEAVTNYLLRTQDPNGAYGYQGIEGKANELVRQRGESPTRTAAGVCSLYISQDYLRLTLNRSGTDGLPSALRRVEQGKPGESAAPRTQNINLGRMRQAQEMGDQWFEDNYQSEPNDAHKYTHYYLYALERYQTFREMYRPSSLTASINWYDDAARQTWASSSRTARFAGRTSRCKNSMPRHCAFCFWCVRRRKVSTGLAAAC